MKSPKFSRFFVLLLVIRLSLHIRSHKYPLLCITIGITVFPLQWTRKECGENRKKKLRFSSSTTFTLQFPFRFVKERHYRYIVVPFLMQRHVGITYIKYKVCSTNCKGIDRTVQLWKVIRSSPRSQMTRCLYFSYTRMSKVINGKRFPIPPPFALFLAGPYTSNHIRILRDSASLIGNFDQLLLKIYLDLLSSVEAVR